MFTALAVSRTVQNRTGLSLRRFLRTPKPLRSATVEINGVTTTIPPGQSFDDPAVREHKLQASSAVWRTASHALWFTDLDLSTTETDWAPPAPFSPGDEDGYVVPPA